MNPVSVTQAGTGSSTPIILDYFLNNGVAIAVKVSGTCTYTVQHTYDNLFNVPASSATWYPYPGTVLVSVGTNSQGAYQQTPSAVQVVVGSGTGSATLTAIEQGRWG